MVPAARRDLARSLAAEAARLATRRVPDHLPGAPTLRAAYQEHAADLERVRSAAMVADLYWVAAPMARAALDASQDVPALRAEDAPTPAGLMVMQEPLPPWDTTGVGGLVLRTPAGGLIDHTVPVPVDAILWRTHLDHIDIDLLTRPSRLPYPLHHHEPQHLTTLAHLLCPAPTRLGGGMPALGPQGVTIDGAWTGPVALLSAAWVMMMTPSVAQLRTTDPTRPTTSTRAAATADDRPAPAPGRQVTIIDLRPMRTISTPGPGGSGRTLTTRHMVRGHWTHQPYGPGRRERRLQWVASYVRGPEGAPWAGGETVYAWRR